MIISADTAAAAAAELGWPAAAEQLLYVIHGMLHLVGYRDKSPDEREEMRAAEAQILAAVRLRALPTRSSWRRRSGPATHVTPRSDAP